MIFILRVTIPILIRVKANIRFVRLVRVEKEQTDIFNFRYFRNVCFFSSLFFFVIVSIGAISFGVGEYYYMRSMLPTPTEEAMSAMPESTRIYDRNGEFLYELHGDVKRRFVSLEEIPDYLEKATIAIEDKNFYSHFGFDIVAIARAFIKNLEHDAISQGASTITQQLARTMFLDQDKKYIRKIKELILAIEIERRYTKEQILEMYLNNIPYGSVAYGVSAASEIYLDKPVNQISLIEAAYLAALPKAPSDYSPFGSNKEALVRRATEVIVAMEKNGYLSEVEAWHTLIDEKPDFVDAPTRINAPHFVFYILEELEKKFGKNLLREGGLDITTSLDLSLQRQAEETINKWGDINEEKYGATNASLVAIDPGSGEVLVMVGSRNYFENTVGAYNVSTSLRQPGSSFKPYVYAAAIENGLSPESFIMDNRTNFAKYNYGVSYIPRNYDGKFHGQVTIRKALAGSLNIPAVKLLVRTGIDKTIDLAENLGLSTLGDRNRFGPSLALGGGEVQLLEHTAALGTFGNEGRKMPLSPVLKIVTRSGETIHEKYQTDGEQVVSEQTAYWINNILSDSKARQYVFGSKSKLEIPGIDVAAKTGTTQDFHDAWTIGYTPTIAVGVWSGNNDNSPMKEGANGYVVATPIWREFMVKAVKNVSQREFARPFELDEDKDKLIKDMIAVKQ